MRMEEQQGLPRGASGTILMVVNSPPTVVAYDLGKLKLHFGYHEYARQKWKKGLITVLW